jgi:hypothetical protein
MLDFAEDQIEDALACGARVEIHGWRKLQGKGNRKWFPIIKEVTLEVLHKMNNDQWQHVREFMQEVWNELPEKTGTDKELSAHVSLFDYPPGIQILVHMDAGATQKQATDFTPKERQRAGQLAADLTASVRASYPLLVLKKARYVDRWQIGYVLRPEVYEHVPGVKDV